MKKTKIMLMVILVLGFISSNLVAGAMGFNWGDSKNQVYTNLQKKFGSEAGIRWGWSYRNGYQEGYYHAPSDKSIGLKSIEFHFMNDFVFHLEFKFDKKTYEIIKRKLKIKYANKKYPVKWLKTFKEIRKNNYSDFRECKMETFYLTKTDIIILWRVEDHCYIVYSEREKVFQDHEDAKKREAEKRRREKQMKKSVLDDF